MRWPATASRRASACPVPSERAGLGQPGPVSPGRPSEHGFVMIDCGPSMKVRAAGIHSIAHPV
jgi:hypothetical protein